MSHTKLLIKNTGILIFGEVMSRVFSFFLIILIARYLGDVGLGKYSFVFAFVGVFSVLSDFGSTVYMTREISRDTSLSDKYFGKVFVFKLLVGLLATVLPVVVIFFTSQSMEIKTGVLLTSIAMFFYYIAFSFRAVVNAFEVQGYQSLYVISERIIAFILGAFVLYRGYGLLALLAVLVLSNASSYFILYKLVSKNIIKFQLKFDYPFIKSFLKSSAPFWFTTIFMTIYFKIDTVMLSFMKDYAVTGWYNAAYKIIDALSFVPFVIITVVFPPMSKFYKSNANFLRILYEKVFYYLALLALPLGLGATMLADRIILFVYKQSFVNSVIALQILMWALVLIFVNYMMGYFLNSIEKQKLFTLTTGLCAVINIILNFILIPPYSFKGAAIATVATEFFNFVMLYYFTSKNGYKINLSILAKPLIATVFMGIIIYYTMFLHLLLIIPIAIAAYFAILLIMRGIHKEELDIAKMVYLQFSSKFK